MEAFGERCVCVFEGVVGGRGGRGRLLRPLHKLLFYPLPTALNTEFNIYFACV